MRDRPAVADARMERDVTGSTPSRPREGRGERRAPHHLVWSRRTPGRRKADGRGAPTLAWSRACCTGVAHPAPVTMAARGRPPRCPSRRAPGKGHRPVSAKHPGERARRSDCAERCASAGSRQHPRAASEEREAHARRRDRGRGLVTRRDGARTPDAEA